MPEIRPADPAITTGCAIVRRIVDDLDREWRVRQVWTETGSALLFQCAVPGPPPEVRPARARLESLRDEELVELLLALPG